MNKEINQTKSNENEVFWQAFPATRQCFGGVKPKTRKKQQNCNQTLGKVQTTLCQKFKTREMSIEQYYFIINSLHHTHIRGGFEQIQFEVQFIRNLLLLQ